MSKSLNILISGAGITGPVLVYFLQQSPHKHRITVVERSPIPRLTGQNVDVRGNGLEVIRRMGAQVEADIRAKTTHEQGLRFVDQYDRIWGEFPVAKGKGFTSEIEIMRGDLANILYEATKNLERVEYIFGEHIASLVNKGDRVEITFAKGRPVSTYDIVIGADGWSSRTRDLAFGEASESAIHSLGQYTAFFKIPYSKEDGTWAQWYNAPGGRLLLLRPDPKTNVTRVWMSSMSQTDRLGHALKNLDTRLQKYVLAQIFTDAGWKTPRVLAAMHTADDFYFQKIAQVKMDTWSTGRTVLVGDAAYAPSPISGMGTTVAIAGAYVLAGEINAHPTDPGAAFKAYEDRMRGFVTTAQKLLPGTPSVANPQTWWGIWLLNAFLWVVAVTGLNKLSSSGPPSTAMVLPNYTK